MEIETIAIRAGQAAVIFGLVTSLWRYAIQPFGKGAAKFAKTLRKNSSMISAGLPILAELLRRWPDSSGPASFFSLVDRIERLSLANEARHLAAMDLKLSPLYICGTDGGCAFANRALCELFGLSQEEMEGSGWLAGIATTDQDRVLDKWQKSVANKRFYEASYEVRNARNGTRFNVTTRAIPVRVEDEIVCYYGIFTEIIAVTDPKSVLVSAVSVERIPGTTRVTIHMSCGHLGTAEWNAAMRNHLVARKLLVCPQCSQKEDSKYFSAHDAPSHTSTLIDHDV